MWTITADIQKGSVRSRISQEEMGTEVEVSGVRGETSHHPRIKGTDNGSRTHGRCRKAPREVEPFAWLGASGTEALLRGQHSEGNVWNVLSRRLRGQYSEENVWNVLSGRLRGQYSEENVWNVLSGRLRGQYSEENVWNVLSGSRIYGQTDVGMLGSQRCDSQYPPSFDGVRALTPSELQRNGNTGFVLSLIHI